MKVSLLDKFGIAVLVAFGVFTAVITKAFPWLAVVLLLGYLSPNAIRWGLNYPNKKVNQLSSILRMVLAVSIVGWLLFGLASVVERIYYANASRYPGWLASRQLDPSETLESLRSNQCKSLGPIEIIERENGVYTLRCGGFSWLGSKTYLTSIDLMRGVK